MFSDLTDLYSETYPSVSHRRWPKVKKVFAIMIAACLLLGLCSCHLQGGNWQEQYDLGMQYLEAGDYAQAIEAFTAA